MSAPSGSDASDDARETAIGVGSGIVAVGFWGLAIDIALKYSVFQSTLVIVTDNALWFFAAMFTGGLVLVAYAAASGPNLRRRQAVRRPGPGLADAEQRPANPDARKLDRYTSFIPSPKRRF